MCIYKKEQELLTVSDKLYSSSKLNPEEESGRGVEPMVVSLLNMVWLLVCRCLQRCRGIVAAGWCVLSRVWCRRYDESFYVGIVQSHTHPWRFGRVRISFFEGMPPFSARLVWQVLQHIVGEGVPDSALFENWLWHCMLPYSFLIASSSDLFIITIYMLHLQETFPFMSTNLMGKFQESLALSRLCKFDIA